MRLLDRNWPENMILKDWPFCTRKASLSPVLKEQKEEGSLGGWLGMMLPYRGSKVVADHNLWPYFARRFGISVVGFYGAKTRDFANDIPSSISHRTDEG